MLLINCIYQLNAVEDIADVVKINFSWKWCLCVTLTWSPPLLFFFFFFANENNLNMLRCDEIEKFAGVLRSRPTSDRHDWRSLSCSFVVQWTENMMMIMMSRLAEQCKMSGDTAPCSRCHPRTVLERILCVETDSGRQSSGCNCFDATAAEI